jgi:tetratricopeptide (TPR) repeat protein
MEPITVTLATGFLVNTAIQLLQDKGPEVALVGGRALYRRLRETPSPPDRDLERAVRRAYLRAVLGAGVACRVEMERQGWARAVWDLGDLERSVRGEIDDTRRASYKPPAPTRLDDVHLLLHADTEPGERARSLGVQLKQAAVAELGERHWCQDYPQRLAEMIEHGWPVQEAGSDGRHEDWFAVMSEAFFGELRRDQRVERELHAKLLATVVEDVGLGREEFASMWLEWKDAHEEIVERLTGLHTDVQKVRANTDVLVERQRQESAEAYPAEEVSDQVREVVEAARSRLFVGRGSELGRLDQLADSLAPGRLVVTGGAGFGKTALLAHWLSPLRDAVVYHFFSVRHPETRSADNACRNLLRQLRAYYHPDDPPRDLPSNPHDVRDKIMGLLKRGAQHGPLTIVLDGLDEAQGPVQPSFIPSPLPPGVHLIVSGRDLEGEYFRGWFEVGEPRLTLERLQPQAVAEWLQQAENGVLAPLVEDREFLRQVDAKTEGYPLYLEALTAEMVHEQRQEGNVRALLERSPKGLRGYVGDQYRLLRQRQSREHLELFALLAVARGALSRPELTAIAGLDSWSQDNLKDPEQWNVTRWFRITGEGDQESYAFTQPRLAEEFAAVMPHDVRDKALGRLLDWCERWQDHRADYALLHYPEHLLDAVPERHEGAGLEPPKRLGQLYELAKDPVFEAAQVERFPADRHLPLRTLQAAILAAAKTDDAAGMAQFVLRHMRRLTREGAERQPLTILERSGLERALEVTGSVEPQERALWMLLLAWALLDDGRTADAVATIEHLSQQLLPLRGWQAGAAVRLLAQLLDLGPERLGELVDRLCDRDEERREIYRVLGFPPDGRWPTAADPEARLAAAGRRRLQPGQARNALGLAIRAADRAEDDGGWLPQDVSGMQALAGDFEAARATARRIVDPRGRVESLINVARAEVDAGVPDRAAATLQTARRDAMAAFQLDEWAANRASFGTVWEQGDVQGPSSGELVRLSLATAREWLADFLRVPADGSAPPGTIEEAARQARDLPDLLQRAVLLVAIAEQRAAAGQAEEALHQLGAASAAARKVEDPELRLATEVKVTSVQCGLGQADAVRSEIERLRDPYHRATMLTVIAEAEFSTDRARAASASRAAADAAENVGDLLSRLGLLMRIAAVQTAADPLAATRTLKRAAAVVADLGTPAERVVAATNLAIMRRRFGRAPDAASTARALCRTAEAFDDPTERAAGLGHMARLLLSSGWWEPAEPLLDAAVDAAGTIEAQDDRIGLVISLSLLRIGEGSLVFPGLERAVDAAVRITATHDEPDTRCFALVALATARAEVGDVEKAVPLFRTAWDRTGEISDQVDRATAVAALVDAWAAAGEGANSGSVQSVARAINSGLAIGPPLDTSPEEVSAAVANPARRAALLTAYGLILARQGQEGATATLVAARTAALAIDDPEGRAAALVELARYLVPARTPDEVSRILRDAAADTATVADPESRTGALARVALAHADLHDAEAALGSFQDAYDAAVQVEPADVRARTLLVLARTRAKAGDASGAEETYDAAVETAATISEPAWRSALISATEQLRPRGQTTISAETRKDIAKGASSLIRAELLSMVALAQARAGRPSESAETFEQAAKAAASISDPKRKASALAITASAQAMAGQEGAGATLAAAREAVGSLDKADRLTAQAYLALAEDDAGEHQQARDRLRGAVEAARSEAFPDEVSGATLLLRLAECLAAVGEFEEALAVCLEFDPAGGGDSARETRMRIAWAQAASGARAAARTTIAGILEPARAEVRDPTQLKSWCLAAIARMQARAGPPDEARATAGWIQDEHTRSATLRDIAEAQVAGGGEQPAAGPGSGAATAAAALHAAETSGVDRASAGHTALVEQQPQAERLQAAKLDVRRTDEFVARDRSRSLLEDAGFFVRAGQRDNFEALLVPCAHYPDGAYGVCELLAREYRMQGGRVAEAVRDFG